MRNPFFPRSTATLTWMLSLACSADGGSAATAGSESETEPATSSDDGTTSPVDATIGPETSPSTSTADDTSDTAMDPDPYDGVWCGTASTGALALGSYRAPASFAPSNGGPRAFAGVVTAGGQIQAVSYDVAAASWSDPVTLQEGYVAFSAADGPLGAVDGEGNAILAYPVDAQMVVQRYDGARETWTRTDLPGDFEYLALAGISMTPGGHAVLVGEDDHRPSAWLLDPVTGEWSAPIDFASIGPLAWAQDPASGDAVLAIDDDLTALRLQHYEAATGTMTETVVDLPGYVHQAVSIGGGEFVLLSGNGFSGENGEIRAHHFDGATWQPPQSLGSGYSLAPVRIVGSADGRAVASWNDARWGTYARTFERGAGWGELLTANASTGSFDGWADHRVVLDDDGFLAVWSTFGASGGISTQARRHDGAAWDAALGLDPMQPTQNTRIKQLHSLGANRARAVWGRDNDGGSTSWVYACHTPVSGWSAPTTVAGGVVRIEARPGGDVLVMTVNGASEASVEYFAAE